MRRLFLILLSLSCISCSSHGGSIYSKSAEKVSDFEFHSPMIHEVVWQNLDHKKEVEMISEEKKYKSDQALKSCVSGLELKKVNDLVEPPAKTEVFALIELVDCMYVNGWRPRVEPTIAITN